ncbi:hypothetical protein HOO54_21705 [Bacillus sp. WMMC1349]|uniref:hypothetical protein n=1 Tax=Bacillus sp. WMMC1349 TaxID=2736254 RepID=UPI0015537D90|nr:hypothetical protein [Bacillus sp. WMMC1349]NPC94764.1 hypothetical protein [Bacillus sp. WMMC1349]
MKNKFVKFLLVLTVIIGSFASLGFVSSTTVQAKDNWTSNSSISYYQYGIFKKYSYTPAFTFSMVFKHYDNSISAYTTTGIHTYGSGKGKIKAILQYKTKKGWKNYKTQYVKKNGYTNLSIKSKLNVKTKFRYKFIHSAKDLKTSKSKLRFVFYSTSLTKYLR